MKITEEKNVKTERIAAISANPQWSYIIQGSSKFIEYRMFYAKLVESGKVEIYFLHDDFETVTKRLTEKMKDAEMFIMSNKPTFIVPAESAEHVSNTLASCGVGSETILSKLLENIGE